MKNRAVRYSAFTLVVLGSLFFGARTTLYYVLEDEAITTRPNGNTTPERFGVPSHQLQFESGGRMLEASLVTADNADSTTPALLLFPGRRETLSRWAEVQAMLYKQGITSMVFDYSGFGGSTGEPSIENLHNDGIRAWNYFTEHVATRSQPRIVLGHSLGTGILMSGVNEFDPQPDLVVLSAPWTTARAAVIHLGMAPEFTYYLLPDVWNNVQAARQLKIPLLVVHGNKDRVIPQEMGRKVADAGNGRFVSLNGIGHRALDHRPSPELWTPILEEVHGLRQGS